MYKRIRRPFQKKGHVKGESNSQPLIGFQCKKPRQKKSKYLKLTKKLPKKITKKKVMVATWDMLMFQHLMNE